MKKIKKMEDVPFYHIYLLIAFTGGVFGFGWAPFGITLGVCLAINFSLSGDDS